MALIFYTNDCQSCVYRKKIVERECGNELTAAMDYKCSYFDEYFQIGGYPENISALHCNVTIAKGIYTIKRVID